MCYILREKSESMMACDGYFEPLNGAVLQQKGCKCQTTLHYTTKLHWAVCVAIRKTGTQFSANSSLLV